MKVKKGDTVVVIAGKDKGAKGKVIQAYPDARAGSSSRASTGSRSTPGSARTSAARSPAGSSPRRPPIHVSNVMVVDADGKPTRVGTAESTDDGQAGPRSRRRNGKDICDDAPTATERAVPRLKQRYRDEIERRAARAVLLRATSCRSPAS